MSGRGRKGATAGAPADSGAGGAGAARGDSLRIRAAWMYFIEQKTQSEISEILGIGRVSVIRLLADARARQEVKITIASELAEVTELERALEARFGLSRALVAPLASPGADPTPVIGAAIGGYVADLLAPGMTVGVGWGRTLFASLPHLSARPLRDLKVISLLGGVGVARHFNPAEFAWRFASLFQGEGYLIPAPALVDSVATKTALIERCGLNKVLALADRLDMVLVSVGSIVSATTFYRGGYLSDREQGELAGQGAVGDLLFHFFDREGALLDHAINQRVMSVDVDRLRRAGRRVLASGGPDKTEALRGAIALLGPTDLVTDEQTARRLLKAG